MHGRDCKWLVVETSLRSGIPNSDIRSCGRDLSESWSPQLLVGVASVAT